MDIDDLLAEVSADAVPQETRDLQELTRTWVVERVAPEILPWPEALMHRVNERIRKQIEFVEEQSGNLDAKTNFRLIIVQTELERVKFIVRSLVRTRIAKVHKHALHYQNLHETTPTLLSTPEAKLLTAHQALLSEHYSASFLGQFPTSLQRLDDTTGGISMIDRPDEDKAVFCRVLKEVGEVWIDGPGTRFEMKRGDVWVVRWSAIKRAVLSGDVEVI